MIKRVIWIVIDSVGIGELPDAHLYKDQGSNTLENIYKKVENFRLPHLESLGLGLIDGVKAIPRVDKAKGAYGKSIEQSPGKDTTTGHWEMAGIILDNPFPTFTEKGFPQEFIDAFQKEIGREVIGNYAASGTEIIQELGDEHVKTGKPIVYTSADSVFQIAAHEEIIPLEELYRICEIARKLLVGDLSVGRVIARPFVGGTGNYTRTSNRHDYSLKPTEETVLDKVKNRSLPVIGVGKIYDIFAGQGITDVSKMKNNDEGMDKVLECMKRDQSGLIFVNLVDFDMIYGHRNDVEGYANALKAFDDKLPSIMRAMTKEDVLIINADHGCDPTTPSTDHSREYIPILVYGDQVQSVNLGIRQTFADIGATICDLLGVEIIENGKSFAKEILSNE